MLLLTGCETNRVIVNNIPEREANEILVFLGSRGIKSDKILSKSGGGVGGEDSVNLWNIAVEEGSMMEAMSILNQNGLPRKQGTNLLALFAKQGLMSSDKEEQIRYQAGLEEQLAGTIRKIDGVIDADVQLSFPPADNSGSAMPGTHAPQKVTAAVYVKHQGIGDDPNAFLTSKIKRLVAGSVNGLDINDVTVISDRARFADVTLSQTLESAPGSPKEFVNIWSIVMSKQSAARFRFLFFSLVLANIVFIGAAGWILWKFYPILQKNGGFKQLLDPLPLRTPEPPHDNEAQ
ncbi:MAG: type III secretion inner membrane ring lipoprotein SctJ [Rhabdochlamydiaceae bacterium]|jgi:type III secretion protein J